MGRTADTVFAMTLRRLWLAAAGVSLIAIVGLLNARHEIARALLVERARAIGLSGFSVDVTSLGIGRATLGKLRVDAGADAAALEIAEIELRYSAGSLFEKRLARVDIRGLRLRVPLRDGAIDFGRNGTSAEMQDADSAIPHPFDSLTLEDARLTLLTDNGELRLFSDLRSAIAPDGAIDFEIALDLQADQPRFAARTRLQGSWGRDGTLSLGPIDCIAIDLPAAWFEVPFHLTPYQPLCLRGDPETSLRMGNPLENPSDLALALVLAPIRLGGRIGEGGEAVAFELDIPEVRIRYGSPTPAAKPQLRLSAAGGRLGLPDEALAVEDLAFDLSLDLAAALAGDLDSEPGLPSGTFALGRIVDLAVPARFGPLKAHGRVAWSGDSLRFGFDLADVGELLHLRIDGQHAAESSSGSLEFALEPLVLEQLGDRLPDLFPGLKGAVSDLSGRLDLNGKSRWRSDTSEIELTLQVSDLGLTTRWGRLSGVEATISLHGPEPFYMAETQRVTLERVTAGVEVTNGLVDFRLRRDGVVEIPLMRWDFAGGIAQTGGVYDRRSEHHEFTVKATGIDLQSLLELLTIDGLSGEGTLAGVFPVYVEGDVIELREAKLTSTSEGGWLRYRPTGAASAVAAQDGHLGQLTQMLDNFRFKSIVISLNGNVLGDVQTAIHLEGANPDFQDGFPVELNLKVESRFWDLIRDGTAAFRLADQLADVLGRSLMRSNR